jgi:hypothetical protein
MASKNLDGVTLPQDMDSSKIQALEPVDSTTAAISASSASARVALPSGAKLIEIAASNVCHWQFGSSSVTAATTNKVINGMGTYVVPSGVTHIAAVTTTGVASAILTITKMV